MHKLQVLSPALNIAGVERETGLSKDTLRIWERRYGFPKPLRDANAERRYPGEQVEKLRLIKRLMDCGHRPGKIISRSVDELLALGTSSSSEPLSAARHDLRIFLDLLRNHQLPDLRCQLTQALMRQGLQRFVIDTASPLNVLVGEAWARGELAVFEEHLYSEQVQSVLRQAIAAIQPQGGMPRVLLTSLPGECHGLGLLMVEALVAVDNACCLPLGTETPVSEIAQAVAARRVDVVALSFSSAFNEKQAASGLAELREMLPAAVAIWAGGQCVTRVRRTIPGVELIPDLERLTEHIKGWRALQRAGQLHG